MPGIGISVFIGAVGAVLRYAVTAQAQGFNIHTAGVILMIVGAVGVVLSLVFWSSLFGRRGDAVVRREQVTTEDGHEVGHIVSETRRTDI